MNGNTITASIILNKILTIVQILPVPFLGATSLATHGKDPVKSL